VRKPFAATPTKTLTCSTVTVYIRMMVTREMFENAGFAVEHSFVDVGEVRLHVARAGQGRPLLLLHGWPEFWFTWEPVMTRLADRFELIAPDLRGSGASDKPSTVSGPAAMAGDIAKLVDMLGLGPVGVVAHDVGASVAQALARQSPDLITGLFFFNFMYPGIGNRASEPARLKNTWHTYFNQSDLAPTLLRASPDGIRLFITHFLKSWSNRSEAFDPETLDAFVANFEAPGNLEGGFAYYKGVAKQRQGEITGSLAAPAPIAIPTCVRWAGDDPTYDSAWTDRLPEFFTNLDLGTFPNAGHFPHREDPERAAAEIATFFQRLDATDSTR